MVANLIIKRFFYEGKKKDQKRVKDSGYISACF